MKNQALTAPLPVSPRLCRKCGGRHIPTDARADSLSVCRRCGRVHRTPPAAVTLTIGDQTIRISSDLLQAHLLVNVAGLGLALADGLSAAGLPLRRVRRKKPCH